MQVPSHVLPNVLPTGLRAVICGTAAGTTSAQTSAYYADSSNCFWKTLYLVGLTSRIFSPQEFHDLSNFRLGLTDIAKSDYGVDANLPKGAFDVPSFMAAIRQCDPDIVAFNGKEAARVFYGLSKRARLEYGDAPHVPCFPRIYILTSTSGSAKRYWDEKVWMRFSELVMKDSRS